jgi:UDP-glucuronate decarboxylase
MHPNDLRVVSTFIVQALQGQPITINGDGSQTRSFCYVDDLVDGLVRLMAAEDAVTGPVNLGNPLEITVKDLAERVIRLTGSSSVIEYRPLPQDDPVRRRPDIGAAKRLLGWEPTVAIDDGLARTIAFFRGLPGQQRDPGWTPRLASE